MYAIEIGPNLSETIQAIAFVVMILGVWYLMTRD